MLNGEKFKDVIKENAKYNSLEGTVNYFYLGDKHKDATAERTIDVFEWLFSEYEEPIKLSRLEYELLRHAKKQKYFYIARDKNERLYLFKEKSHKSIINGCWSGKANLFYGLYLPDNLFQFIRWEDEKPTSIDDILNNCEIIEEEDKC